MQLKLCGVGMSFCSRAAVENTVHSLSSEGCAFTDCNQAVHHKY
jgi:hypothetical protein